MAQRLVNKIERLQEIINRSRGIVMSTKIYLNISKVTNYIVPRLMYVKIDRPNSHLSVFKTLFEWTVVLQVSARVTQILTARPSDSFSKDPQYQKRKNLRRSLQPQQWVGNFVTNPYSVRSCLAEPPINEFASVQAFERTGFWVAWNFKSTYATERASAVFHIELFSVAKLQHPLPITFGLCMLRVDDGESILDEEVIEDSTLHVAEFLLLQGGFQANWLVEISTKMWIATTRFRSNL